MKDISTYIATICTVDSHVLDTHALKISLILVDSSNLFAEVVLKSKDKDIDEEISLYEPVGNKLHFNDLKVIAILS